MAFERRRTGGGAVTWAAAIILTLIDPNDATQRRLLLIGAVVLFVIGAWFLIPESAIGWVREWAEHATTVNVRQHPPEEAAAAAPEEPLSPIPRDPDKKYEATLTYEVVGQGRFRALLSGLRDVGNGWDHGVEMTVEDPSGRVQRAQGWQGLDTPVMRRFVEEGSGVYAEMAGPYTIRWVALAPAGYASEVIAEQAVMLEPTGPLEGWSASHHPVRGGAVLTVERHSPEQDPLRGFQCIIKAPGDEYVADDRRLEEIMFNPPSHKAKGEFMFPRDFAGAPEIQDLRDGEYPVFWTAWETVEGDVRTVDVARDVLRVDRNQNIV